MSNLWQPKYSAASIFIEAILPVSFQGIAIVTLLFLAHGGGALHTFSALILSIIWLKLSETSAVQEYGKMRANRKLFIALGEWLGRNDAADVYDDALSEQILQGTSIEHETFAEVTTAMALANGARAVIAALLKLYLLVQVAIVLWRAA